MTTATPAKKKPATAPLKKAAKAPAKPAQTAAKAAKPAPAKPVTAKPVLTSEAKVDKKKDKVEKVKVVRDSFTIPKTEYAQIVAMKKRAVDLGLETKKSELIRAGLTLLASTSEAAFRKALGNVPTLKTGRPGKA
ncbi:MAG: hypothetical protein ACKOWC_09345 [Limnohabitans sp.]